MTKSENGNHVDRPHTTVANGAEERRVFRTPPRWTSWRRLVALVLGMVGLLLCYQLSYLQLKSYYSRYPIGLVDIILNLPLLWPLIPSYIGLSNFIGIWGFINRIEIDNEKITVHLLGPFGRESRSVVLDSVQQITKGRIIGIVNGKQEEFFIKRKHLTNRLRTALLDDSKSP